VYILCRKLGVTRAGAVCASLLFAINACAAEPVGWIDAGFDLVTTGFVLLALILTCRYLESGGRECLAAALCAASAAVFCKESAYCLPALMVCIIILQSKGSGGRRGRYAFLWVTLICGVLFAYRWWAVGGLGGYGIRGLGPVDSIRHNFVYRM